MGKVSVLPVLTLKGPPRLRGQIHGEALREPIRSMVEDWKASIAADTGLHPDRFFARFMAEADYLRAVRRWTPDLLDEVEGIAEGSGLPFEIIFARQLSDEEPWLRLEVKFGSHWGLAESCSALGITGVGGRPPILAQNMDSPHYYDGYQVLLRIQPPDTDLEALVFTIAGKISLAGLNNRGVGICCNSVLQLDWVRDGLPEDFVVRGFLAQPTLDEALAFMHRVKHASGQNYVVGGPERVLDLEVSAHKICEYVPYPGADRVWHTNHPLANDDVAIWRKRIESAPPHLTQPFLSRSTSQARLATLARALGVPPDAPVRPWPQEVGASLDTIRAALSSHDGPVCIDGDGDKITSGCLIMELSVPPVLHVAPGPPCSTPSATHAFERH